MFLINMKEKKAISLEKKTFSELELSERYDLQEWIVDNPNILGENLLIIQKEFDGFSDTNERLDLLALDEQGRVVVIENKLDDSGRDVVWQALKYVSYCATLTKNEICEIYAQYLGTFETAIEKISEFFDNRDYDNIKINPTDRRQRIILVAANFRKEVTSTVLWLRDYGIDISCIKVTPYKDSDRLYLDVEHILPIQDIGDYQIRLTAKKQEDAKALNEDASRASLIYRFWETAIPVLRTKTDIYNNTAPTSDYWLSINTGHKGVWFSSVILKKKARAEIYIRTNDKSTTKKVFNALLERKNYIEEKFGAPLDWQECPDKSLSRVCVHCTNLGVLDEEHWEELINFLANNIAKIVETFKEVLGEVMIEIE